MGGGGGGGDVLNPAQVKYGKIQPGPVAAAVIASNPHHLAATVHQPPVVDHLHVHPHTYNHRAICIMYATLIVVYTSQQRRCLWGQVGSESGVNGYQCMEETLSLCTPLHELKETQQAHTHTERERPASIDSSPGLRATYYTPAILVLLYNLTFRSSGVAWF